MALVDCHVHSYFSDGIFLPEKLVEKVRANGAAGFALTDHDTFDGIPRAIEAVRKTAPELFFMPGCELSTFNPNIGEVHVLGYFPDGGGEGLDPMLDKMQELRNARAYRIVELLNDRNVKIDFDEFTASVRLPGSKHFPLGRMQIARFLVNKGYFNNPRDVFDRYLKAGRSCYVPRHVENTVDSLQAVKTVRENGGLPVIAHPLFLEHSHGWRALEDYIKTGLFGIEYRHPKVSQGLSQKIEEYCEGRLSLFGGSDFHGDAGDNQIGTYGIPIESAKEVFDNFQKK